MSVSHATTRAGIALATLLLGGTLSACGGSSSGDTTCGEFKDMSAGAKRDLIKQGVDESGDQDAQDTLADASDDELDQVATFVVSACDGVDDDTKLDDVEG